MKNSVRAAEGSAARQATVGGDTGWAEDHMAENVRPLGTVGDTHNPYHESAITRLHTRGWTRQARAPRSCAA